jgi:hypothetical protein
MTRGALCAGAINHADSGFSKSLTQSPSEETASSSKYPHSNPVVIE